jgi:proteasome lid subunit RPN8/RPN11
MIALAREAFEEMHAHARLCDPAECCGLIGGVIEDTDGLYTIARSVYRLRNVALDPRVAYEAAPEELFAAQKTLRARGEQLLGIYHSHPREGDPLPSQTDVRRAYYPSAIYFIVGLKENEAKLRAFRLYERENRWERVGYKVLDETPLNCEP